MLQKQRDAADAALREYEAITAKAEANFKHAVDKAKMGGAASSGGSMGAVDHMLARRGELLTSERISQQRYRAAVSAAAAEVGKALTALVDSMGGVDARGRKAAT